MNQPLLEELDALEEAGLLRSGNAGQDMRQFALTRRGEAAFQEARARVRTLTSYDLRPCERYHAEQIAARPGIASQSQKESEGEAYRRALFSGVPLLATRLVREQPFRFAERTRVSSPAEVAQVFIPYFADKDREECLAALADTAHILS